MLIKTERSFPTCLKKEETVYRIMLIHFSS